MIRRIYLIFASVLLSSCNGYVATTSGLPEYGVIASAGANQQTASPTFSYPGNPFRFTNGLPIVAQTPTANRTILSCTVSPTLPTGLNIDSACVLSGTPVLNQISTLYTVTATTDSGDLSVDISIAIASSVSTPTFSVPGGTYGTAQSITLSCTTGGATIYYTTDGSAPTSSSSIFSGTPIPVSTGQVTINAYATAAGFSDSSVASATYLIASAPTGLSVGVPTSTSLPVSWSSASGAIAYDLLRDTSIGFGSATVVYSGGATNFTDTVSAATTYYYAVRAVYASGTSPNSAIATAITLDAAGMPVAATVTPGPMDPPVSGGADDWAHSYNSVGWIAGGYSYVIFDHASNNATAFVIGVYDTSGTLVNSFGPYPDRYVFLGGVVINDATGNIEVTGQSTTTYIPFSSIFPP